MLDLLVTLLFLTVVGIACFILHLIIEWRAHRDMVKMDCATYGKAKYKDFVREFNKYDWELFGWTIKGLWNEDCDCKYHASVIKFNNIGMMMKTPWDFFLVEMHVKNYLKKRHSLHLHDWSKMN